jgi:hypothetical protein
MQRRDQHQGYSAEVEMCDLFATRKSLKLREMIKSFLPNRNIHAKTLKLWSRMRPTTIEIRWLLMPHAAAKSP